jgi:hypothetical protein
MTHADMPITSFSSMVGISTKALAFLQRSEGCSVAPEKFGKSRDIPECLIGPDRVVTQREQIAQELIRRLNRAP